MDFETFLINKAKSNQLQFQQLLASDQFSFQLREGSDLRQIINDICDEFIEYFFRDNNPPVDLKGHLGYKESIPFNQFIQDNQKSFLDIIRSNLYFDFLFIFEDWINKQEPSQWQLKTLNIMPQSLMLKDLVRECPYCGERIDLQYNLNEGIITPLTRLHSDPCPSYYNEYNDIHLEIPTPSQSIVFGNDLRFLLTDEENEYINGVLSVNNLKGQIELSMKSAECNMAQLFVGNTSPSIIQDQQGLVHISQFYDDAFIKDKKELGFIITDLWWVCLFDRDDFLNRCHEKGIIPEQLNVVQADINGTTIDIQLDAQDMFINGDGSSYCITITPFD